MTDNNCKHLTESEILDALRIQLQDAKIDLTAARKRIAELEAELEHERIRLAACGVVALSDTAESAAKSRDMAPEYRSASCDDVARAVDNLMAARHRIAELEDWQRRAVEPLEMLMWIYEAAGVASLQESTARALLGEVKP